MSGTSVFSAVELDVRPIRIRWTAYGLAFVLLAFFVTGALLVNVESSGFRFRVSDQVAMVVLGVVLAGGALLFARPRLRAGPEGVEVRTSVRLHRVAWSDVLAVSFPDGAQFARLDLPDDDVAGSPADRRAVSAEALAALDRWRARAESPLTSRAAAEVSRAVVRSLEAVVSTPAHGRR